MLLLCVVNRTDCSAYHLELSVKGLIACFVSSVAVCRLCNHASD